MKNILILTITLIFVISPLVLNAQAASLDYSFFIKPEFIKNLAQDLDVHSFGLQGYYTSDSGQKIGWATHLSFPVTPPDQPYWGDLDLAILLGQQFLLGPIFLAGNIKAGGGISYSNLGQIAVSHFSAQLRGEIELGLKLSTYFIATSIWGVGGYASIAPGLPGDEYLFWEIYSGLRFIWLAQTTTVN